MKEANIFEAWVNNLAEGTWAIPDTPEKQKELVELLSKEFPVGADATNATEQLYDLLGDDELFDQLEALADKNPDADCRQVVYDRMQMLSNDPNVQEVINQLQIDASAEMNPAEPTDAGMSAPQDTAQIPANEEIKDPATQTEDPEGTKQPTYPEYADDLESILKIAGVPAGKTKAIDYEPEVKEGTVGALLGGAAGALLGGPVGAVRGAVAGDAIGDALSPDEETKNEDLEDLDDVECIGGDSTDKFIKDIETDEKATSESALQGQYGHSGKLKSVAEDTSFLDRLKELSGMIRN